MLELHAISPAGGRRQDSVPPIFESARLQVRWAPWVHLLSLRRSRKASDVASLDAYFRSVGIDKPSKPNALSGTLALGCAWLEPQAWLICSAQPIPATDSAELMGTDISDRVGQFLVSGSGARDVIAAGCDASIVATGSMARTRFGGMANVIIERYTEQTYRLTIDVSLSTALASWLLQAASNQS